VVKLYSVYILLVLRYARDYSFVFNANKTICTNVGKPKFTVCDVLIDNHLIQWSDHFTYLGAHFVSGSDLSVNVAPVRRKFYVACNSINARSHGVAEPVRVQLVKSCCLPLITYCVHVLVLAYETQTFGFTADVSLLE